MEKEKLISELQARLGKTALSERTMNEYAASILPSISSDEQVNDAFWAMHTSILKTFEGNMNHEIAASVNRAKEDWLKNRPNPQDPPKAEPPTPTPNDDKYEKLMQKIESLEKHNEEVARKHAGEALRSAVLGKASELNVSNRNLWNDVVSGFEIADGMDAEQLLEKAKGLYESKQKAYFGDGAVPYGGSQVPQRVSKETANAKREAFKEKMRSQGKLPND